MSRLSLAIVAIAASSGALAGCRPSVESLCEKLDEDCYNTTGVNVPYDECVIEGEQLEVEAEHIGCDEAFDDYVLCVADNGCLWEAACGDLKDEVFRCVDTE